MRNILITFWTSMLLMFLLTSCQEEDDTCVKGEYTKGAVCIEIYEPVCAPDGTTYMNSCYAQKDGWDNSCIVNGECNG
tara:strand:+ start:1712 stop:1945 length:234 start_codon:yes stop_codon:yes gene_type:complete